MKFVLFVALTVVLLGVFAVWARKAPRRDVIRAAITAVVGAAVGFLGSRLWDV